MILKLFVEEPGGYGYRTIASYRAADPLQQAGWYVARRDSCIVIGMGMALDGSEVVVPGFFGGELTVEADVGYVAAMWEGNFASCIMSGIDRGTELRIGEDPQLPASSWQGNIQLIEEGE